MPENWLPVIPRPPHDPTWWLLDGRQGWKTLPASHLTSISAGEILRLRKSHADEEGQRLLHGEIARLILPANIGISSKHEIYLLDTEKNTIKYFDPCQCNFVVLDCIGNMGADPREFNQAQAIGIQDQKLYVCDTGKQRVVAFSLYGLVLKQEIRPPVYRVDVNAIEEIRNLGIQNEIVAALEQRIGHYYSCVNEIRNDLLTSVSEQILTKHLLAVVEELRYEWRPTAISFDSHCHLYIADVAAHSVHRFSANGDWENAFPIQGAVTNLVIDKNDLLWVISSGQEPQVLSIDGNPVNLLDNYDLLVADLPMLEFGIDEEGNLYLSDLCIENDSAIPAVFDSNGNQLDQIPHISEPTYFREGTFHSKALDSNIYKCQWHRVVLQGSIPPGSSIEVATYTAESISNEEDQNDRISSLTESAWKTNQIFYSATETSMKWECLVDSPNGRYLWLRLRLRSNGVDTPKIESIAIEYPRISLRRYLPSIFSEDISATDFTDRFLSIFDTTLRSIEHKIDYQAKYLDPLSAPSEHGRDFLSWLESWLGIMHTRNWSLDRRRRYLKQAGKLFKSRGTRFGLWKQLLVYLGMEPDMQNCVSGTNCVRPCHHTVRCPGESPGTAWEPPPLILEHFQLRRWLYLGHGRLGDAAELWGKRIVNRTQLENNARLDNSQLKTVPDPIRDPFHVYAHKFSVFVPSKIKNIPEQQRALRNFLAEEKPAHTEFQIEYVQPRMRIGVQSMVGYDSVVGIYPQGITLDNAPLRRDTVLKSTSSKEMGPAMEIGQRSRIGSTTRLE